MTTERAAPSTERSRSMMIAAVYGDGTPPTWFIQRLDDVIAAARAEAARLALDGVRRAVEGLPGHGFGGYTVERAAVLAAIDEASRDTPDAGGGKCQNCHHAQHGEDTPCNQTTCTCRGRTRP